MDTERDRPAGDAAEAAGAKKKPRAKKPAGVTQPKKVAAKKKPSAPKAPRVRKAKAAAGEDKSAGVKQAEATAVEGGAAPTASAAAAPTAAAPEIEVELRQAFLQQIYNKLYQTHPGQDAASMGKYAVAIEVGHFQKAASRNDYIATLNKELERMEQIARAQLGPNAVSANAGGAATVGNQMRPAAQQNGHGDDNRFASRPSSQNGSQLQQPLSGAPARVPPTSSAPSFSAPMNGQGYAASQQQQQQQQQQQSGRPATSAAYEQQNAQYYSSAQTPQQQQQQQQLRQQQQQQNLQNAQQISYQEFAQQFQQIDKNALIGHLWTQKITLMQWQSHINQLEMRVASLQDALNASYQRQNYDPSALRGTQIPQQGQYPRGFNQQPREQASRPPTSQPLNAETLRAHDLTMAALNGNPEVYWRRVGVMKAMYLPALLSARDALENHQAPPNTAQGYKAENMKQNVVSALSILCEAPQSAEPRSFEVLDSIERFMHNTVKPIVERIQTKVTAVRNSANGMDSRAGIPTNQQQRPPPSGGHGMPISYDPRMQDPRAASGRTSTNSGNARSEIRSMTESSSARMLNGLESPFGEPRVTLPTFSPSERRMASAGGAVAAKEDSKKSGSSRYEESLGGFEDLPEIAFDDEAQKSGESPAGNSPAASDKAVGTDA